MITPRTCRVERRRLRDTVNVASRPRGYRAVTRDGLASERPSPGRHASSEAHGRRASSRRRVTSAVPDDSQARLRHCHGVVVEDGYTIVFALGKLHAAPTEHVDRGYELETRHRRMPRLNVRRESFRPWIPRPTARVQRRSAIAFPRRDSDER